MRDVYCDVHDPAGSFPVSHFTGREKPFTPHRYDYVFTSAELKTASCEYLGDWHDRDENKWRPSDHAPVVAELLPDVSDKGGGEHRRPYITLVRSAACLSRRARLDSTIEPA